MRFLNSDVSFFKSYDDVGDFLTDLSYTIVDPAQSFIDFFDHLKSFITWSYPLTLIVFFLSASPLLFLLSIPIAAELLTINIPIVIGIAIFAGPALYSLGMAMYDLIDLVLSPMINLLKIATNLGATFVESVIEPCFD